jgi:hypothetical protein
MGPCEVADLFALHPSLSVLVVEDNVVRVSLYVLTRIPLISISYDRSTDGFWWAL